MDDPATTIVGIPVCDLLDDGSGAKVWLERADGPAIKLQFTKAGLPGCAAKLAYVSARLASQGATGQTVGLPVATAKVLEHSGTDQITIATLLADGNVLQLQFQEDCAIELAREIVAAALSLRGDGGNLQ